MLLVMPSLKTPLGVFAPDIRRDSVWADYHQVHVFRPNGLFCRRRWPVSLRHQCRLQNGLVAINFFRVFRPGRVAIVAGLVAAVSLALTAASARLLGDAPRIRTCTCCRGVALPLLSGLGAALFLYFVIVVDSCGTTCVKDTGLAACVLSSSNSAWSLATCCAIAGSSVNGWSLSRLV